MSQETQAWAKEVRTGDPVSKAVLIEIANWAKPDGSVEFLSLARLADVLEISKRSVQRHLNRLEFELRFIRRSARHREDGGQGANSFELLGYQPPLSALDPRDRLSPPRDASVTPPRQNDHAPRDTAVTRLGDKNILPPSEPDGSEPPKGDELPIGDAENQKEATPPAKRERAHGVRIDPNWKTPQIDELPESIQSFVRNWAQHEYLRQGEKFYNHWRAASGRNAAKRDWAATWRNWLIEAEERGLIKRSVTGSGAPNRASSAENPLTPVPRDGEDAVSEQIRARLVARLGKQAYTMWFAPCAVLVSDFKVTMRCPSAFHASWLPQQHEAMVMRACRDVLGERFSGVHWVEWRLG